jgi:predicted nucleic acid-binding protein
LIVFDASTVVSAVLKADSVPERALFRAEEVDVLALSAAVDDEFSEVLSRPKFARAIPLGRRDSFLRILRDAAYGWLIIPCLSIVPDLIKRTLRYDRHPHLP